MIDDIQMLGSITETADMGRDSLRHVIEKTKNPQLRGALEKQYSQYDDIYRAADGLLLSKNGKPKMTSPALKAYSHMVSNFKTETADNATSKIAEMVIQGSTMGVTEITKQLHEYQGSDNTVRSLAEKHVKIEQDNIEEMKKFL